MTDPTGMTTVGAIRKAQERAQAEAEGQRVLREREELKAGRIESAIMQAALYFARKRRKASRDPGPADTEN